MKTFITGILLLLFHFCFSQKEMSGALKAKTLSADTVVFDPPKVQKVPEFPGGDTAMLRFISKNIIYPNSAKELGIQGTVYLTFIVERNGALSNITVLKGVSADDMEPTSGKEKEALLSAANSLSEEAIRVVKLMPSFIPGIRYGTEVRVKFLLPVKYVLK